MIYGGISLNNFAIIRIKLVLLAQLVVLLKVGLEETRYPIAIFLERRI